MAYVSLYRKYRPDSFDKLFGQDHIVRTLINQIKSGAIGHAYLFTGTRGTGKTSCAKIFARAINCLSPENGSPCGKCAVCRAMAAANNMDILEIDAASNNGVEEIRDLREKIKYPPVHGKYKVYIIDEVHMLTTNAFNALLKTLEEPPEHAVMILATTEAHKLPATILSRCMRFDFRLVPTGRIAQHVAAIFDEQGKEYERAAVNAIAEAGEGSVRDALSVADMCMSYGEGKLTLDDVLFVLGASDKNVLYELARHILKGETARVLEIIDNIISSGRSVNVLVRDIASAVRNLLILKYSPGKDVGLESRTAAYADALQAETDPNRLLTVLEIFCKLEGSIRYSTQPRILLEAAAVRASAPGNGEPDIQAKIAAMEKRIAELESGIPAGGAPRAQTGSAVSVPEVGAERATVRPTSAGTLWGQLIRELRQKNMFALMSSASEVRGVSFSDGVLSVRPENTADIRLLSLDANVKSIEGILSALYGDKVKFNVIKPDEATGNELEVIKRLAEPDAVKIF